MSESRRNPPENDVFYEPIVPEPRPERDEQPIKWLPKHIPRTKILLLPALAIAVFTIIVSATSWAYFVGSGPSESTIERRLNDGDAQGAGYPYRYEILVQPDPETDAKVPATEEAVWELVNSSVSHNRPRFLTIDGEGEMLALRETLDPSRTPTARFHPPWDAKFDVEHRSGRDYSGRVTTEPTMAFRLHLDSLQRFESLVVDTGPVWVRVIFSYDGKAFGALQEPSGSDPGAFDLRGLVVPAANHRVGVELAGGLAQPSDLEMRFVDANGTVVRSVDFEWTLDADGYYFRWKDVNANGAVDQGDLIFVEVPDPTLQPKVWNRWIGRYTQVSEDEGGSVWPWLIGLGSLGAGGFVMRNRRRRLK